MRSAGRDVSIDILATIGIILVVMGHSYQPQPSYFKAYSFHMPLFFAISGYLFKIKPALNDKISFLIGKIKSQLVPYVALTAFFSVLTHVLQRYGYYSGVDLSIVSIVYGQFIHGHVIPLAIPLWFLFQLFLLNVIFQAIYLSDSRVFCWLAAATVLALGVWAAYHGLGKPTGLNLLVLKTLICGVYFQVGMITKQYEVVIRKVAAQPVLLFWSIMLLIALQAIYGEANLILSWANVGDPIAIYPIALSLCILFITFGIAQVLSETRIAADYILLIGRYSFWIMSFHLLGFFLVNLAFYKVGLLNDKLSISSVFFCFDPERSFIVYLTVGIYLPILIGVLARSTRVKFERGLAYRLKPMLSDAAVRNEWLSLPLMKLRRF